MCLYTVWCLCRSRHPCAENSFHLSVTHMPAVRVSTSGKCSWVCGNHTTLLFRRGRDVPSVTQLPLFVPLLYLCGRLFQIPSLFQLTWSPIFSWSWDNVVHDIFIASRRRSELCGAKDRWCRRRSHVKGKMGRVLSLPRYTFLLLPSPYFFRSSSFFHYQTWMLEQRY